MKTRPLFQLELELCRFLSGCGIPQEVIAKDADVSQSSVSRACMLSGRKRLTKELVRLCNYAKIPVAEAATHPDPKGCEILMGALLDVWDGTEEHALGLARVINEVGRLRPSGHLASVPRGKALLGEQWSPQKPEERRRR